MASIADVTGPTASTADLSTTEPAPVDSVEKPQLGDSKVDEPQNALTREFTEEEWKALKEFRSKLPEAVAKAFPKKSDAKTAPVELWGVSINPTNPVDARVSVILMKFLRARDLDVTNAQAMFVSTLEWRQEFKIDEVMKEEFPQDIFESLGHVYGKDREGRPVTYNIYGGNQDLKSVFSDVPRFIRWRVALMEKGVRLIDFETVDSMVQVHDYEGVGLSSRDANSKAAAAAASKIFQDYYPEFLAKKFFVNVPSFMTWIFWIFKSLLSAKTFAKMSVVGSGIPTLSAALSPVIDSKELPKRYGGEAEDF